MARSYKADAVVLRSMRFGEADRVLHLYTAERGRVNAIAKGVRKTDVAVRRRLEPLTRPQLLLHEGRGELHTVSGADIVASHAAVRAARTRWRSPRSAPRPCSSSSPSPSRTRGCSTGSSRFLDLLEGGIAAGRTRSRDSVGLGFQLKLLALAGYLPHLELVRGLRLRRAAGRLLGRGGRRRVRALRCRGRGVPPAPGEPRGRDGARRAAAHAG